MVPSIRSATGSGSQRLYSFKDLAVLKVVKNLLDTGVSLNNIRVAVEQLRRHGVRDLARITLFSDGVTVYECTSPEEVVDLLQGGQGVFGIAVGGAMREISGSIARFPAERADTAVVDPTRPEDELASRAQPRSPLRRLTPTVTRATRTWVRPPDCAILSRVVLGHRAGETCTQKPLAAGAEGATPPRNLSGIPDRAEETTSGKR